MSIGKDDNELLALEMIHSYVEVLDKYFRNVCELDIIYRFDEAYYILDEMFIGGEYQESSKSEVLSILAAQNELVEADEESPAQQLLGLQKAGSIAGPIMSNIRRR